MGSGRLSGLEKRILLAGLSSISYFVSEQAVAQNIEKKQRLRTPEEWVKP